MTIHRVKMCSCGHAEDQHEGGRGRCMYGHDHVMGGCTCPGFGRRRRRNAAPSASNDAEPALVISNLIYCEMSADARGVTEAIYALAQELRAVRKILVGAKVQRVESTLAPPKRAASMVMSSAKPVGVKRLVDGPKLRAGERRMLEVLARHHPAKLTRAQLGTLVGLAASGGTFGTYLSVLKRHELVELVGELVSLTKIGLAAAGGPGKPMSRAEIVELWRAKLRKGERAMLDAVLAEGDVTREKLAELASLDAKGGTFGTYLSVLRRNDLVIAVGNRVRLGTALAEAS